MKPSFICLISLLFSSSKAYALRVLGLFPMAAKSHFSCNQAIMRSLHAVGHNITLVSPFPSQTRIENYTTINSRTNRTVVLIGQKTLQDMDMSVDRFIQFISTREIGYCHDVMTLPVVQEALRSKEKLYDVMFVELIMSYECFLPIAEVLDIPVVGTITLRSWKLVDYIVGLPNNPMVIPFELSISKPEMNFVERVENLWNHLLVHYYYRPKMKKMVDEFYQKYFAEDMLHKKRISMVFYNNHASLLPRSTPPNAVEIGGVHLMPAKPLPENLKKFIEEASHGVVLLTFGSFVKASSISNSQREAFLEAFDSIPQRVIWKYEEPVENLPKNILLLDWLPQRDILEHKNVVAFISHCGLGGVYEAIVTGTPVITIPIFGDQRSNAALLRHRKVAINLDLKTLTKESILTALDAIINDTSYHQRMRNLSRAFKDRPMAPQEEVVYWTEYVVRHNGAPYLTALGTNMPLYKFLMLDIVGAGFITFGLLILSIHAVIRGFLILARKIAAYKSIVKDKNQ